MKTHTFNALVMVVLVFVYARDRETNTLQMGSQIRVDPDSLTIDHVFVAEDTEASIRQAVVDWYVTTLSNDDENKTTYEKVIDCTYYEDGWFYKVIR